MQRRSQFATWAGALAIFLLVMAVLNLVNYQRSTPLNKPAETSRVEGISPVEPADATPNPLYEKPERTPREEQGISSDALPGGTSR